jgi:hypothetical protein
MLLKTVLDDLTRDPDGADLTTGEAAAVLRTTPVTISQRVLCGAYAGKIEDGRVIGVSRSSIRVALGYDG